MKKIIRESAVDEKKKSKNPGLKFKPRVSANRRSNNGALDDNKVQVIVIEGLPHYVIIYAAPTS